MLKPCHPSHALFTPFHLKTDETIRRRSSRLCNSFFSFPHPALPNLTPLLLNHRSSRLYSWLHAHKLFHCILALIAQFAQRNSLFTLSAYLHCAHFFLLYCYSLLDVPTRPFVRVCLGLVLIALKLETSSTRTLYQGLGYLCILSSILCASIPSMEAL